MGSCFPNKQGPPNPSTTSDSGERRTRTPDVSVALVSKQVAAHAAASLSVMFDITDKSVVFVHYNGHIGISCAWQESNLHAEAAVFKTAMSYHFITGTCTSSRIRTDTL